MDTKSLTRVEIKDASKGLVTAVFATFDVVDLDGDMVLKSAVTDGAPVVVSGYGHTSWEGTLPIGKGTIRTTDTEAILEAQFLMGTSHGADAFKTVDGLGELQQWSWSLENVTATRKEIDGQMVRVIESVDITEVSPVLKGSSVNTRTLATKNDLSAGTWTLPVSGVDLTDPGMIALTGNATPYLKAGARFSEHVAAVLTAVEQLNARAAEVVTLRAEQGKTIGAESVEVLGRLDGALDQLKHLLTPTPTPDVDPVTIEWLRSVANLQGVTP